MEDILTIHYVQNQALKDHIFCSTVDLSVNNSRLFLASQYNSVEHVQSHLYYGLHCQDWNKIVGGMTSH